MIYHSENTAGEFRILSQARDSPSAGSSQLF